MKTKNIKYLIILVAFAAVSCAKLKEDPRSFIPASQFYKTQADAVAAVTAAYSLLNAGANSVQTPYNTLFNTGMNFMGDDEGPGPGATNADVRSQSVLGHSASGLRILQIWQQHYAAIKKANIAIDTIPDIKFDATLNKRLVAEAKFLRALYYFNLVRLYGDVPLVLHDQTSINLSDLQIQRTAAATVYAQIETDLTNAAADLPNNYTGPDVGRATAGAANSLLAKVYLTERKWDKAVAQAEAVINGPYGYDLFANYADVFLPATKNGKEHIFSAQFKSNSQGQGNNQAPRSILNGIPGIVGSYADQVVFYPVPDATKPGGVDKFFSIYKLYPANDKRKRVSFVTRFQSPATNLWYGKLNDATIPNDSIPFFNKYYDPGVASNEAESGANVPIIRFSDVLLIHAEAENELNGPTAKAYASINRVRKRAGLDDLAGLDQASFRNAVYLERRLEFVFEYQRWFDLIRERDASGNGILEASLLKVGKTNVSKGAAGKFYLFPIPQQEIDNSNGKLTQNPGWQ
ncbi:MULTISPECIES: RagB/SusD family nutrient uptake outer membrane protein [Mucilaginibacter]|uniref:RagB/SusD family nutrient uptake outer membrane protein n=1 Tax=Mucilaginibacter TaxID=423349 RepID=UPI0008711E48|nr:MULTISPECIES: RagB/SusD family nutrient uptake outer membrane protein [Mucilaginibacter]GGB08618.1 membrane protein [Mucilaginibacter rubeus]SCW39390.1 Starch-binding associating with outer membrane [Mucilaginibacter sp. NFR10]